MIFLKRFWILFLCVTFFCVGPALAVDSVAEHIDSNIDMKTNGHISLILSSKSDSEDNASVSSAVTSAPENVTLVSTADVDNNGLVKNSRTNFPIPPAWMLWVTAVVALVKFAFDLIVWIVSLFEKKKNLDRSILDDFWYRTIVLPTFLEPMMEFISEFSAKLRSLDESAGGADDHNSYLKSFQVGLRNITNKALILSATHEALYEIVSNRLDLLEDAVTAHCAIRALGKDVVKDEKFEKFSVTEARFFEVQRDIVAQFINHHRKLFK